MQISQPPPSKRLVSLTPLIDVVFILLLFFMMASNFIEWRAIGLNVATGEGVSRAEQTPLIIRINPDGTLILNNESITLQSLGARTRSALSDNEAQSFVVQPEANVPLQEIVRVLDRMAAAGGRNISLARGQR